MLSVSPAASRSTAGCGAAFTAVPSGNLGHAHSQLIGVDAKSKSLAWASGFWRNGDSNGPDLPLLERWNGNAWVAIQGKAVTTNGDNDLNGVGIVSAKSVWAVGSAFDDDTSSTTLVEHWTPSGVKVVPSPSPRTYSVLNGMDVVTGKDIWAVGSQQDSSGTATLIEHWNGKKWAIVPSPSGGELIEVSVLGAKSAWAVGSNASGKTLVEHWNGKKWTVVASPNAGNAFNGLAGVDAVGPKNVWAVGYVNDSGNHVSSLVEHWNGKSWTVVSSPSPGALQTFLFSVDAVSPKSIWAVGVQGVPYTTTALHWNGSTWTQVSSPSPSTAYNSLDGVKALPSGRVWAVGDYNAGSEFDTLVLQRCG